MIGRARHVVGWLAVAASTIVACVWGFWGGIENFHEGWFYESLLMNLGMMVAQYLLPIHSPVIYWWTATELDKDRAYIIVYNGFVSPRLKRARPGYLAFRAVR